MATEPAARQCCSTVQLPPHREQIKALIRMQGLSMSSLCRSWGYSESAIRTTLTKPWPKIEGLIAKFVGVHPRELWPDRYDAHGKSLFAHQGRGRAK